MSGKKNAMPNKLGKRIKRNFAIDDSNNPTIIHIIIPFKINEKIDINNEIGLKLVTRPKGMKRLIIIAIISVCLIAELISNKAKFDPDCSNVIAS